MAVRVLLLALVVALPDGRRARSRGVRTRLRVPHAPPLRSLPLPVDAQDRSGRARAGAQVRRPDARGRGALARVPRGDGAAARAGRAARTRGAGGVVPVRARRLGVRRGRRRARPRRHQRQQAARSHARADPRRLRSSDVRVQELLVRAVVPDPLHRRRSRRPRARHARELPRQLGAGRRRAPAALRRALRQHGGVPPSRQRRSERAADHAGRGGRRVPGPSARVGHRGRAHGPGRLVELRHRLRAVGRRLVRRPRDPPRGAGGPGRAEDRRPDGGGEGAHPRLRRVRRRTSRASCARSRPVWSAACCTVRSCSRCRRRRCRSGCSTSRASPSTGLSEPPPDTASIVSVNEGVLADAIAKRLVHVVHGSMRIHVHLRPGGRQRRPRVLGPPGAVGARVRPVPPDPPAPARRGGVAAPCRRRSSWSTRRAAGDSRCPTACSAEPPGAPT